MTDIDDDDDDSNTTVLLCYAVLFLLESLAGSVDRYSEGHRLVRQEDGLVMHEEVELVAWSLGEWENKLQTHSTIACSSSSSIHNIVW